MSALINEIFDSGDYFMCKAYRCRMLISACITRQKNSQSRTGGFANKPGAIDPHCKNCKQGEENMNKDSSKAVLVEPVEGLVCKNPDCIHKYKVQGLDNFYKHKHTVTGYENQCKDCRKKENKKNKVKNKSLLKQTKKETPKKTNKVKKLVTVDFTDYANIYSALLESAENDFRPPEMQMLYLLKQTLVQ